MCVGWYRGHAEPDLTLAGKHERSEDLPLRFLMEPPTRLLGSIPDLREMTATRPTRKHMLPDWVTSVADIVK